MTDDVPYLVEAELVTSEYMRKSTSSRITRIVMATSVDEVRHKLERHFESESVEYAVSYYVRDIDIHEPIW